MDRNGMGVAGWMIVAATLALAACRDAAPSDLKAAPQEPVKAPAARLVAPEKVTVRGEVLVTGTLRADQTAMLSMSVPGTLQKVHVSRGQAVEKGDLLATLDDQVARATLAQAQAGVKAAEAQLAIADDALARVTAVHKEQGVTDQQFRQTEAQRGAAAAGVAAAKAVAEQAEVNLRYQSLKAPWAGVILKVPDGTGMPVAPGFPLFLLEATATLVLDTSATQAEASAMRQGATATVTVPATGALATDATVRHVVPMVDPMTNRVPIEIAVPNPEGRFLPHAFARARIAAAPREGWKVPIASLVQREGAFACWAAGTDGRARTVPVQVLTQETSWAVVVPGTEGWPDGAGIVAAPPPGIVEGMVLAGEAGR